MVQTTLSCVADKSETIWLLAKYRHFTHPMREDVKRKHFCTALRETSNRCLHPGPLYFVERILLLTPGAPQSTTGIRAVAGLS